MRKLERYELIEEIGQGGMAVVYRGRDSQLERAVAVKVLHPHLQQQPESKQRFHREAKAVARLRHPNIPEIYDYSGADAQESYIVTELIPGPTLKRFYDQHPDMPVEIAARIVIEVCLALEHAHEQGIIHRDVKPENVMIAADGVVKLTDFGIAQMLDSTSMTVTGQILGSPAHMSPEHLEGKNIDFRADVFSIGTVLYWLVVGRLPFEGRNPHQVLKKIFEGDYPDPVRVRPAIGERMAGIVRRCLAVAPDQRFATVMMLRRELEGFLRELGPADETTLRRYFADPDGFVREHEPALVRALVEGGTAAVRRGDRALAIRHFNRVLAIDPQNREVLRCVRAMVRRRRTGWLLGGLAVLAIAALGVQSAWPTHRQGAERAEPRREARSPARSAPPGRPRASEPAASAAARKTPAPSSRRVKARRVGGGSSDPAARGGGGHAAAAGQRTVRFVAGPSVRQFDVWVDGVRLGAYGPDLTTRVLAVGTHSFRFVTGGNCCVDAAWTEDVLAGEGEQRIGRALRFRPANLSVETNVPADVEVAGRARGRSQSLIQVPMNQYTETLRVIARAEGYRSAQAEVELRPNEVKRLELVLAREGPAPGDPTPRGADGAEAIVPGG